MENVVTVYPPPAPVGAGAELKEQVDQLQAVVDGLVINELDKEAS